MWPRRPCAQALPANAAERRRPHRWCEGTRSPGRTRAGARQAVMLGGGGAALAHVFFIINILIFSLLKLPSNHTILFSKHINIYHFWDSLYNDD
jgi:hypothetical protein